MKSYLIKFYFEKEIEAENEESAIERAEELLAEAMDIEERGITNVLDIEVKKLNGGKK